MRSCHYTITPNDVQHRALDVLQAALRLADHGPKCTARAVLTVLAWAAACGRSIAAACAALRQAPSDQAVRNALLATLPEYARLQAQLNQALADGLPKVLRGRKADVAIDLTLLPYYGLPAHDARELYRSKQKAGTRYFHAYATAYVILRGCRYTLGLRGVWQADPSSCRRSAAATGRSTPTAPAAPGCSRRGSAAAGGRTRCTSAAASGRRR